MDSHQAAYVSQRRDLMVKHVDEQLRLVENKKRTRETADEYADMSKRTKLAQVNPAAAGFQHGTTSSLYTST